MAQPVYSVSLLQLVGHFGNHTVVVPSGFLWVVRDVWGVWTGTTDLEDHVSLLGDVGQQFGQFLITQLDPSNMFFWQGRTVLQSSFTVQTTSPTDITASGYQLSLP